MYRAITDYNGSKPTISLQAGDTLSAVHSVDDTWYVGHNDRSGETGAFPASFVESLSGTNRRPTSVVDTDVSMLPEKPVYTNISKQIQERLAARNLGTSGSSATTHSSKPRELDVNRPHKTKPEKSFKLKFVKKTSNGESHADPASGIESEPEQIFSKENTLQRVRFESIQLEHSISTPGSEMSWQNSSFEDSYQLENYDGHYTEEGSTKTDPKLSRREKLNALKTSTENLIGSGRDERKCVKAVLGLIGGIIFGVCLFIIYRYIFGYTFEEVGIAVSVLTILISICLALSSFLRHVMLLVIPNFFTGTGRAIMLSAIFALIVQYPVSNISQNAKETGRSMSCIIDIAVNQSRLLEQQLSVSLKQISTYVEKQEKQLKESTKEMHNAIGNVKSVFDKIEKGAADAASATQFLRQECSKTVNDVKSKCDGVCTRPAFPLTELCKDMCKKLDLSSACAVLDFNLTLAAVKDTKDLLQKAIDYFNVDIYVEGYFSGDVNTSKQSSEIQKEVEEDIGEKVIAFHVISSIVLKCLPLPLLILIFAQSFWYLRNYLAKDGYDNKYITSQFKRLDKTLGDNRVLPLKKREENIYVDTRSIMLNSNELAYCKIGLVQVAFHLLMWVFVTLFDYALYYILYLVKEHGGVQVDFKGDGQLSINVEGTGPAADFYRIMVQGYNSDNKFNSSIDIGPCLPDPVEPNHGTIPAFIVLYLITVAIVLLRAYGMRLRIKCAANYCPEQEMARLDYLHKRIRHKRVGFLKFLRQQIKSTYKENEVNNQLRFSTWLAANFPLLAKLLPERKELECTSCEQHATSFNKIEVTKCKGTRPNGNKCDAAYCKECLEALQNACPLCTDKDGVTFRE